MTQPNYDPFIRIILDLKVNDLMVKGQSLTFQLNGLNWMIYPRLSPPDFTLLKEGERILSFSEPESLQRFFQPQQKEK